MNSIDVSLSGILTLFSPVFNFIKNLFDSVSIAGVSLLTVLFTVFFIVLFLKFIFNANHGHLNIRIHHNRKSGDD